MHDEDDDCDHWRCSAWNNPVLYLAAAFVGVFLLLRLGLSLWIFYEKRRLLLDRQQHNNHRRSSHHHMETISTTSTSTSDLPPFHQRQWELESVEGGGTCGGGEEAKDSGHKVLVIMAGDDKPTFLAKPM